MLKSLPHAIFALLLITVFAGCEDHNYFLTKAGIDSKLQGKWNMVRIPITEDGNIWEFNNGSLIVSYLDSTSNTVRRIDTGTYEIVSRISSSYLVLTDPKANQPVTGRWVIINIDNQDLTLNHQSDNTYGTLQREFVKQ